MGSLFQPRQSAPPPPPPPPPATIRDEIGGVEQVPVKNEDGTVTYITRQIPLTAEQQAEQDAYNAMRQSALDEIQRLSSGDFTPSESTQKTLNAWEQERRELLEEDLRRRETQEEELLARRGLGDSSAAQSIRRQRTLDRQDAFEQLGRERDLLQEDVRQQQLGLQQNLFNIAQQEQLGRCETHAKCTTRPEPGDC